ncbi:MAG: hypothetical protein J2P14_16230 [Acidothermales bacterium]|nr:hypothetical protein [Acidothermales bacterium]
MQHTGTAVRVGAPPDALARRTRVTWALLFAVFTLHTALVVAQPILAGAYLNGSLEAMRSGHAPNADAITLTALLLVVPAAVLFRRPGRGPRWIGIAAPVLFAAEGTQVALGWAHQLALHIPLGVAIVGTVVAIEVWLVRYRVRIGRRARVEVDA